MKNLIHHKSMPAAAERIQFFIQNLALISLSIPPQHDPVRAGGLSTGSTAEFIRTPKQG